MTGPYIDYQAVFRNLPVPALLMTRGFVMVDMSAEFLRVSGRTRDQLLGRSVFSAFPDNPKEPSATGTENLSASLHKVLATGERDSMPLVRYDVEAVGSPGVFEERYWCPVNAPVLGPDGKVMLIINVVVEIPDLVRTYVEAQVAGA